MDQSFALAISRKLVFFGGKGGVGKTRVSQAVARFLALQGKNVLWATFEDPNLPTNTLLAQEPANLKHINLQAAKCFEEYAALKIGVPMVAKLFTQNRLMRYLAEAAPGIHELVLLGKIWFEREHYDHVVVDLPSTGYGLAMFQSVENFRKLFHGGPIARDADAMLATFRSAEQTAQVIVSLPEEMPLQESLEMRQYLLNLFPGNQPSVLVNRVFPALHLEKPPTMFADDPRTWQTPLAVSGVDYCLRRRALEQWNLKLLYSKQISFSELPYELPAEREDGSDLVARLSERLAEGGVQ